MYEIYYTLSEPFESSKCVLLCIYDWYPISLKVLMGLVGLMGQKFLFEKGNKRA